jgi:hypothetical protein
LDIPTEYTGLALVVRPKPFISMFVRYVFLKRRIPAAYALAEYIPLLSAVQIIYVVARVLGRVRHGDYPLNIVFALQFKNNRTKMQFFGFIAGKHFI